jgi:hypothetical protein
VRDVLPNMTDYLATRASFRLEVPEVYDYARELVDAWDRPLRGRIGPG